MTPTPNHSALGRVVMVNRNKYTKPVPAIIIDCYAAGCGPAEEPECYKLKLKVPWEYNFGPPFDEIYRRASDFVF